MRAFIWAALFSSLTLASVSGRSASEETAAYKLIVHPSSSSTTLRRQFIDDVFLKRVKRWPEGDVIHPVDLARSSAVRRRFTRDVLRRSLDAVEAYWQQRIFSGAAVPPPAFDTDDDVVRYVTRRPGAIGYVSIGAPAGDAKVVTISW